MWFERSLKGLRMIFNRQALKEFLGDHVRGVMTPRTEGEYDSAVFDSREVQSNVIFVALKGETNNGVSFIPHAIDSGAGCLIIADDQRELAEKHIGNRVVDRFYVDDPLIVFGRIGAFARELYIGEIIGVIGSVGKTTTKNLLREAGGGRNVVHANRGSYNNETGVPLTLAGLTNDYPRAVIELGESHFGDLEYITSMARPHILVITNVGQAHTEYLGDTLGVATTFHEAVENIAENGTIVLPDDIEFEDIILGDTQARVVRVYNDTQSHADGYSITDIVARQDLTHDVEITSGDTQTHFHLPLVGKHFVVNAVLAIAASCELGDDINSAARNIGNVQAQGHRMRVIEGDIVIFDDCYNANPTSVVACMSAVAQYAAQKNARSIFILGPMRELGDSNDIDHINVIDHAFSVGIDKVFCVGQATRNACEQRKDRPILYFNTVPAVQSALDEIIAEGDIVGVKASRGPDPHRPYLFPIVESLKEKFVPGDQH